MGTRKIKVKKGKVIPTTGRHFDLITYDDLVPDKDLGLFGRGVASNVAQQQQIVNLTLQSIQDLVNHFKSYYGNPLNWHLWNDYLNLDSDLKKVLMGQVELYKNVIETEFGVKLSIKDNIDTQFTTMELLVPNELFASEKGKEKLAEALQNIAMFILSLEDKDDSP